jgi:AraC-like DNA-binding protein
MAYEKSILKKTEQGILNMLQNEIKPSLPTVASTVFISPRQLQRIVKLNTGLSFTAFRQNILLNYAQKILKSNPHISLKHLSRQLGFSDPHYFSTLLKKNNIN